MTVYFYYFPQAIATYEDGKLILNLTPVTPGIPPQKTTRELVGDEMLMVRIYNTQSLPFCFLFYLVL